MGIFVRSLVVLMVLAGPCWPAFGAEALPDAFVGKFRGELAGTGENGGQFNLVISRSRSGFVMRWPTRLEATFEPAGRPGVFRDSSKSNPLAGDPVYWARIADGALMVYAAQIDSGGGYLIRNYSYTPAGDDLDVVMTQIASGDDPAVWKGRLTRYDR